jgi:selenocysteine lyase/cysteine desulfurase
MTEIFDRKLSRLLSEDDVLNLRKTYFPDLADAVFLNVAGGSPMCRPAARAASSVIEDMTGQGDRHFMEYIKTIEIGRARLAEYLEADSADDIAFTVNSSSAAAAACRMLLRASVRRVFCPGFEFPTSTQAAIAIGLGTVFFGNPVFLGKPGTLASAIDQVRDESAGDFEGSAMIASHVNYVTGARVDLTEAAEVCRERKMILCVNATQSFGALPISAANGGPDIVFGSGLKWAHAGFGTGFLFIRRSLIERFGLPELTSWLSVRDPGQMDCTSHEPVQKTRSLDMGGGAPPFQTILALCGSLDMIAEIGGGDIKTGVRRIEQRMIANAIRFRERLASSGSEFLLPTDAAQRSGIVSIAHKRAAEIVRSLEQQRIYCTLRRNPFDDSMGVVRFGVPFFALPDEIDRAAEAASKLVTTLLR